MIVLVYSIHTFVQSGSRAGHLPAAPSVDRSFFALLYVRMHTCTMLRVKFRVLACLQFGLLRKRVTDMLKVIHVI